VQKQTFHSKQRNISYIRAQWLFMSNKSREDSYTSVMKYYVPMGLLRTKVAKVSLREFLGYTLLEFVIKTCEMDKT
jgi:hypothetical protein